MSSVNRVFLLGRVGKDPEVRATTNSKMATFSLATSEKYNGQEEVTWHNIVVWSKLTDIVEKYVKKGDQLLVEGKIKTRSYESNGEKKYVTEITATNITMLGGKKQDDLPY